MKLQIICNPTSGNGTGKQVCSKIESLLKDKGLTAAVHFTDAPQHAERLAREAAEDQADIVIAIGGDGTLHEVAQGLADTGTALGIIPSGTGNDFVKSIHVPIDPEKALDVILTETPKPVDTVRINKKLFLNECGCGFDVMVLDYAEKAKKHVKGLLPYLHGVIQTILHYRDTHISYSIDDGEELEKDLLVVAVANGRFIGGGIPIAPNASPDDGKLDVLLVDSMNRPRMFSALPGLLKGSIQTFPETAHCYARKVHIRGNQLRINVDGEIITMDEAEIEIKPSSLLVCRP